MNTNYGSGVKLMRAGLLIALLLALTSMLVHWIGGGGASAAAESGAIVPIVVALAVAGRANQGRCAIRRRG
jgi:hypothetical protein